MRRIHAAQEKIYVKIMPSAFGAIDKTIKI
jgi:hypothetical protein